MTIDEMEDFFDNPDGRIYQALLSGYPTKTKLKLVGALKAQTEKERRRLQTEALKIKFRIQQRRLAGLLG